MTERGNINQEVSTNVGDARRSLSGTLWSLVRMRTIRRARHPLRERV